MMNEQDMKKLSRAELLEVIVLQAKESEAKDAAIAERNSEIARLRAELDDRTIRISESGNLAEASLAVTNIFAEAERAVVIYKENIARAAETVEEYRREKTEEANRKAEEILYAARERAERILDEARKREERAKETAERYWDEVSRKLEMFCKTHKELSEILAQGVAAEMNRHRAESSGVER